MTLPSKVLSAAGVLFLLFTSLLLRDGSVVAQPQQIAEDVAVARLNAHIESISARSRAMNSLYQNTNFGGDIEGRLLRAGAKYTSPDNHILRWQWSHYGVGYYDRHIEALRTSIKVVQTQHYATQADIDYLDRGMEMWKGHEERVRDLFDKEFSLLVNFLKDGSGYIAYRDQNRFDPDRIVEKQLFEPLRPRTNSPASTMIRFPGARPNSGWW